VYALFFLKFSLTFWYTEFSMSLQKKKEKTSKQNVLKATFSKVSLLAFYEVNLSDWGGSRFFVFIINFLLYLKNVLSMIKETVKLCWKHREAKNPISSYVQFSFLLKIFFFFLFVIVKSRSGYCRYSWFHKTLPVHFTNALDLGNFLWNGRYMH